jgi:hypothetical protein
MSDDESGRQSRSARSFRAFRVRGELTDSLRMAILRDERQQGNEPE